MKSLLTTDAKVATADAASVDFASAVLGGTLTDATADATCGVVISTSSDVEAVRAGLIVKSEELKDSSHLTIHNAATQIEVSRIIVLRFGHQPSWTNE